MLETFRSTLLATYALLFSSVVLAQASTPTTELSINDVAILVPYFTDRDLPSVVPSPFDFPNPEKFAPGVDALPLDGEPFISSEIMKTLSIMLVKDTDVRAKAGSVSAYMGKELVGSYATAPQYPDFYKFVALRVDPCANFAQLGQITAACKHEVRVTWQSYAKNFGILDTSIHSIHSLDKMTFAAFINELRSMRARAGADVSPNRLRVQPQIAREGKNSAYLKSLIALMHRYLRTNNLTGVAVHDRVAYQDESGYQKNQYWAEWAMAAVSVQNGKVIPVAIPVIIAESFETNSVQRLFLGAGDSRKSDLDSEPSPLGSIKNGLFPKMVDHEWDDLVRNYPSKFRNSFLVQNPKLHNRLNTDCMSCHVAEAQKTGARDMLERFLNGAELDTALKVPMEAFSSSTINWNTSDNGATYGSLGVLQMFGFSNNQPVIMPGVINDAALSLENLKQF